MLFRKNVGEKLDFKEGDIVGPYGIIFVRERTDIPKRKQAEFICPSCHQHFVACLYNVKSGNTKKCRVCGRKTQAEKRTADLIGKHFGYLVVLRKSDRRRNNKILWECACVCGKHTFVTSQDLLGGCSRSCGCKASLLNRETKQKDIAGQRFGYWTAIAPCEDTDKYGKHPYWYFRCENCGRVKKAIKYQVTRGQSKSCGCIQSYGEQKIIEILDSLEIDFETEYSFETCRNPKTGYLLRFDFYLSDYNLLIEYDGKQHFDTSFSGWGRLEPLENLRFRDKYKDEWAKQNNIYLKRIPYTDFDKMDRDYILQIISNRKELLT